jgi:hypothetical protein
MITQERLKELVSYDANTGVFTWNKDRKGGVKAGSKAGCVFNNGYVYIGLDGRSYTAHRLVWLYVSGTIPMLIDHINRDRADNRICNLRVSSHSDNGHNSNVRRNNASGFTGVSKAGNKWNAYITVNRKRFNLGYFASPELASAAYSAAKAHHGR